MDPISENDWSERYGPLENPFEHAPFTAANGGQSFVGAGIELAYLLSLDTHLIWTIQSEADHLIILPGYRPNGVGYFICDKPWTDDCLEQVLFDY